MRPKVCLFDTLADTLRETEADTVSKATYFEKWKPRHWSTRWLTS